MRFPQIFDMRFKTRYDIENGLPGNDMQWALILGAVVTCAVATMRPELGADGRMLDMGWINPLSSSGAAWMLAGLLIGYAAQLLLWNATTRNGIPHGQMIAPVFAGVFFLPFLVGAALQVVRIALF